MKKESDLDYCKHLNMKCLVLSTCLDLYDQAYSVTHMQPAYLLS